jgi:hypothetical protein
MGSSRKPDEMDQLFRATARLNSKVLGLVLGILFALLIFVATNWLLIKGGPVDKFGNQIVGPHLQLLGQFFIGYKVSFLGSLIGAAWGFVLGTISGSLIAWVYNRVADRLG